MSSLPWLSFLFLLLLLVLCLFSSQLWFTVALVVVSGDEERRNAAKVLNHFTMAIADIDYHDSLSVISSSILFLGVWHHITIHHQLRVAATSH